MPDHWMTRAASLIFLAGWAHGTVPLLAMLSTSGDLVLGAFFGLWLWRTRPHAMARGAAFGTRDVV